jgi:hypothetical protein
MLMLYACEKSEVSSYRRDHQPPIENREVDDCDDCPNIDDCCCSVTLTGTTTGATLYLCGTTDPVLSSGCGPTSQGTCYTIQGEDQTIVLDNQTHPRGLFCMQKNASFLIGSQTVGTVTFAITCQYGQFAPQTVNVSLTAPDKNFYTVNGDCELASCE